MARRKKDTKKGRRKAKAKIVAARSSSRTKVCPECEGKSLDCATCDGLGKVLEPHFTPPRPRIDVDLDLVNARDSQGRPVREGHVVRRVPYSSVALRAPVPTRAGLVLGAFRREADGRTMLDVQFDRDDGAAGRGVFDLGLVTRSRSDIRGLSREDWFGAREAGRAAAAAARAARG